MPEPLAIRCSALPLATRCPASIGGSVRSDTGDESAALGSAVHEVLAGAIRDSQPWGDLVHQAASRWSADAGDVAGLVYRAWKCWEQLREHFPNPEVEVELQANVDGVLLTGHADVLSVVGDEVRVLDWKSGRAEGEHEPQLRGYALCAMLDATLPPSQRAYVATVLVRQQEIDPVAFGREELLAWWSGLAERLRQGPFVPGTPQCVHCPRRHDCGARTALLQQTALVMAHKPVIDAGNAGVIYDRVRLLENACTDARDALKVLVTDSGGALPLGDGRQLVLEPSQRRELDASRAIPVLREFMAESQIAGCLKVSNTLAEAAVKDNAPPRGKGAAAKELWRRLEEEGAVVVKEQSPRLECRKHVRTINAAEIPADDPRFQPAVE